MVADIRRPIWAVDLLEDLVEERGWSTERYGELLAVTARRTLLG